MVASKGEKVMELAFFKCQHVLDSAFIFYLIYFSDICYVIFKNCTILQAE